MAYEGTRIHAAGCACCAGRADAGSGTSGTSPALHAPTVDYSVTQAAQYLQSGYWGGARYQFDASPGETLTVNLAGLTRDGRSQALKALDAWSDVTGIRFAATGGTAQIHFDDAKRGAYASFTYEGGRITSASVNIEKTWSGGGRATDSYVFQTYLHEIGHALGLGHAGGYNEWADYGTDSHYANDSWQMSVMSYFSQTENLSVDADFAYAITPMAADIAAIQDLYGVPTTRAGDTAYGSNGNTGTYLDSFAGLREAVTVTLWDNGGTDLLDLRLSRAAQHVDLTPGAISDIMGHRGNLLITAGTVIENLRTGTGSDFVMGNDADNLIVTSNGNDEAHGGRGGDILAGGRGSDLLWGDGGSDILKGGRGNDWLDGGDGNDILSGSRGSDRLSGGAGNDRLIGGSGRDVLEGGAGSDILHGGRHSDMFLFADGCGSDVVMDMRPQGRDADRVSLSGLTAIVDWDDLLLEHLRQESDGCIIDAGGGDVILLSGLPLSALGAEDFLF